MRPKGRAKSGFTDGPPFQSSRFDPMTEPIVFLPGYMCDSTLFTGQIAALEQRHVIVSAPLSGERCEEMASAILPHLPARFALAGASLGGVVALEIMRRAADRVSRLCLISTDALGETPGDAANREPMLVRAKAGRLSEAMEMAIRPQDLAPGTGRGPIRNYAVEMGTRLGAETFLHQTRALQRRRDHQSTLRKIKVPVQIIAGAHDQIVTPKRQGFMAELIADARFDAVQEAGHLPSLEAPVEVLRLMESWLERPLVLR